MTRAFKPREAVTLPRLDATSAVALALLLVAAAEPEPEPGAPPPEPLPPPIAEALGEVKVDLKSLQVESAALEGATGIRSADLAEDNAFGSLRDWLAAWARLPPGHPSGDSARKLLKRLFPDGLGFVRLPVEKERAVADGKLAVIQDEGLGPAILALGGGPLLEHVQATHAAYGKIIDAAKAGPADLPAIREKLDRLLDAMQIYTVRVMASVERDAPATQKRAEDLLRPLLEWDRSPPAPKPPASPPDAPDGGPPA